MVPGKSWYTWFRLYGPLEAYFDKLVTGRSNEFGVADDEAEDGQ